jgi:hypothetical protein
MKLTFQRLVDQVLASDEPCLGAVFCTYTFDPAYFEEQVLRALLRLSSDPEEDGARFHEEARAALRETPVACFVDASVRRAGRRLPYDLHLVRKRTFHPKVILVLYEDEARLAVGSGNVTRPGFEGNAELFFHRSLRYDDPADAAMLRAVDGFLAACLALATGGGSQLAAVLEALRARIASTPALDAGTPVDAAFVHTFEAAGLRWLADALPPDATVRRIGVLSPYFERDDLDVGDEHEGLASVLVDLLALRPGKPPALDLAVPWEDPPLAPPPTTAATTAPALEAGLGLWAWRWHETRGDEESERLDYYVIERITAKRVEVRDAGGRAQRLDRAQVEADLADRRLWPVPTPTVHAPAHILQRIRAEHTVELWLHPTATLSPSGRPLLRPLHAKLFLITVARRGAVSTYALVGSANASRAALNRTVAEGGNVEAGVVLRLDGEVRLRDLLPSLVAGSLDGVRLEERAPPAADIDLSAWIDDAVHHADARTLTVTWAIEGPAALGPWTLRYLDRVVARGDEPGAAPTVVGGFDLASPSAELDLETGGRRWTVPIRVADLAVLPTGPELAGLDLRALLALLGRRVGGERLATLRTQRGPAGVETALDAVFGEGFGPTDVFKAWWGLREDLSAASTVAAFRYRLLGVTGAKAVWRQLFEVKPDRLSREEVWLYGCELVRELKRVELGGGPDRRAREAMLAEVVDAIRGDLRTLAPAGEDATWLGAVRRFYAGVEAS